MRFEVLARSALLFEVCVLKYRRRVRTYVTSCSYSLPFKADFELQGYLRGSLLKLCFCDVNAREREIVLRGCSSNTRCRYVDYARARSSQASNCGKEIWVEYELLERLVAAERLALLRHAQVLHC